MDRKREPWAGTTLPNPASVPGSTDLDAVWNCHEWLALGLGQDPQALLPEAARDLLEALGARFAAVNAPRAEPGTTAPKTADAKFLDWTRRCRASAVLVRPDRFIAERLAPGRTPACLGLFHPPAETGQPATGEAA